MSDPTTDRIEELRAWRDKFAHAAAFVDPPEAAQEALAVIDEALEGWEKAEKWKAAHMTDHHATCREVDKRAEQAEAELTQLREALESERYHAGYNIHDDLDREEHQQDTPDCPACAALTQENPE